MDISVLNAYVADKRLKRQSHPTEDILIWNYSEHTQFKKLWDDVTLQCRGLVTDTSGNIIARSFNKFFNENERPYEATPDFTVYSKLDGSLGILFYYRNRWILASRGSFASIQAQTGMDIINDRYPDLLKNLDRELAYSFEIIYPENRIVVNYGDERKLVFLSAFRKNGEEVPEGSLSALMTRYGVPVVPTHDATDVAELKGRNITNEEGYVIRFGNGTRIKIKFQTYIALHRLVGNVNETMLLQQFSAGKTFEDVCEQLPDEFHKWADKIWKNIGTCYDNLVTETTEAFREALKGTASRGEFARKVIASPYKGVLFDLYESKDPRAKLMRFIDATKLSPTDETGATAIPGGIPGAGMSQVSTARPATLIILYGISGSGKSTFAKRWVDTHRDSIVVNREELVANLTANRDKSAEQGKLVTALAHDIIRNALLRGVTVLADSATYLAFDQVKKLLQAVPPGCEVQVRVFDTPIHECLERMFAAGRSVDMHVLEKQENIFLSGHKLIVSFVEAHMTKRKVVMQDSSLPPCFVFDIDGTLSIRGGNRGPYDEGKVHLDTPNADVVTLAKALNDAKHILHICTGRTEACREATESWLASHGIIYLTLQMRAVSDTRSDYLVKEDMWRNICEANYIVMMMDDRSQVVHHARTLGFTVAQTYYGEF